MAFRARHHVTVNSVPRGYAWRCLTCGQSGFTTPHRHTATTQGKAHAASARS